jgi:hypothetical protein
MMTESRTAALAARIKEVFAARDYPGDDNLVYDNSGYDLELVEIAEAFRGKHWRELSPEMLRYHHSALSFFASAAFRYYLLAFMLGAIEHSEEIDVALDGLMFHLTPLGALDPHQAFLEIPVEQLPARVRELFVTVRDQLEQLMAYENEDEKRAAELNEQQDFEECMGGFSPQEKAVIREFLEIQRDDGDGDAALALDAYWGQFPLLHE